MVHIVFALLDAALIRGSVHSRILSYHSVTFRHNHHLFAWDVVFLDCLADNLFRRPIAVRIGGVPRIDATIIGSFQQW